MEWDGKERMNGGQSIYTCEWAPVYRNREWHFFFGTCGLLHLICKPISSVLLPHRRRMPWLPAQAHPPGSS